MRTTFLDKATLDHNRLDFELCGTGCQPQPDSMFLK